VSEGSVWMGRGLPPYDCTGTEPTLLCLVWCLFRTKKKEGGPPSTEQQEILKTYARRYLLQMLAMLEVLPSSLLMLLKTNDCLRHIDTLLGTPINTIEGERSGAGEFHPARCCSSVRLLVNDLPPLDIRLLCSCPPSFLYLTIAPFDEQLSRPSPLTSYFGRTYLMRGLS